MAFDVVAHEPAEFERWLAARAPAGRRRPPTTSCARGQASLRRDRLRRLPHDPRHRGRRHDRPRPHPCRRPADASPPARSPNNPRHARRLDRAQPGDQARQPDAVLRHARAPTTCARSPPIWRASSDASAESTAAAAARRAGGAGAHLGAAARLADAQRRQQHLYRPLSTSARRCCSSCSPASSRC